MTKWFNKHVSDIFVRKAQIDGYRARSVYKLQEICEANKLFIGPKSIVIFLQFNVCIA